MLSTFKDQKCATVLSEKPFRRFNTTQKETCKRSKVRVKCDRWLSITHGCMDLVLSKQPVTRSFKVAIFVFAIFNTTKQTQQTQLFHV